MNISTFQTEESEVRHRDKTILSSLLIPQLCPM